MQTQQTKNADFCGSLPLHLINQIQDVGVLFVLDKEGTIIQVSQNVDTLTGSSAGDVVGRPIADYLDAGSADRLTVALAAGADARMTAVLAFGSAGVEQSRMAIVLPGVQYDMIEVELQAGSEQSFLTVYADVKTAMARINEAGTLQDAYSVALEELKKISGFDRLLIYRFDEVWNGTVIAELREPHMDAYIGLRFPASDVPQQARALYQTNPYRLIPNREYAPVRLHPIINPITATFTDLSRCNLRSVAGVHLEYMKNMSTMASMSTRILQNGKLWGLISCHHHTPKFLSYEKCSVFELVADMLASRITVLESSAAGSEGIHLQQAFAKIVEELYRSDNLMYAIAEGQLMELFGATGLVYARGFDIEAAGDTPPSAATRQLLLWLSTRYPEDVYSTDRLQREYDEWRHYEGAISGVLSIPLRTGQQEFILLFRPEMPEDIVWGGNPNEALQMEPDGKNYHPRASFRAWQESVRGKSEAWNENLLQIAVTLQQSFAEWMAQRA